MPVRWHLIVIDFWLTAALSLWRHFSPNTLINSEATLWRAWPASDSGKDSKMFEPCSQQTQRFYGKRRYEKNNWEQNAWVDFRRDINFLHTNIKKDQEMCPHWLQRSFFWAQENCPYLFIIDWLIDWLIYLLICLFIHSSIQSSCDADQLTAIHLTVQHFFWSRSTQYPLAATLNAQFSSNLGNAVKNFGSLIKDRLMKSDRAY